MLHGCTQSAADIAAGTRLNAQADERGFIVLYPEQPGAAHPQRCWHWYDPAHQTRDAGEPGSIAALTIHVAEEYRVDRSRIYVAGISAGAIMAVTVALAYPDVFAAVGSHSGTMYGIATDVASALALMRGEHAGTEAAEENAVRLMGERARLIPLIIVHGDNDLVVRPVNARLLAAQWSEVAARLGLSLELDASERFEANGRWATRTLCTCEGRPVLTLLLVEGLGHAWSGGSSDGTYTDPRGPDAASAIVDFLLVQRLER